jgi:hypothetical protein
MGRRLRGIFPAAVLFFIAPLIGEFLLGNMPITMLGMLAILAPVNGGAALLIREFVRRSGRGWGSILLLGLAYGILEEAFLTETLFNPNYLGLNLQLLQPAFFASLGIGLRYTIFVLTLHTVWSIGVPIALVEALVPERALAPWLGRFGTAMVAVIFTLAAVSMASFSIHRGPQYFEASPRQFLWSAMACLALMGLAFGLRKPRRDLVNRDVPGPWVGGLLTFGAASIFMIVPSKWGGWAVACYLLLDVAAIVGIYDWSGRTAWDGRHRLAIAGGAAFAYAWHAFLEVPALGTVNSATRLGNFVFAVLVAILVAAGARATGAFLRRRQGPTASENQ